MSVSGAVVHNQIFTEDCWKFDVSGKDALIDGNYYANFELCYTFAITISVEIVLNKGIPKKQI